MKREKKYALVLSGGGFNGGEHAELMAKLGFNSRVL